MTTPLYHLLLAGASLAAILLTRRRHSASRRLGCVSRSPSPSWIRAKPYSWPTGQREPVDRRHRTGRTVAEHDVGRGLAGLAALAGRPPSARRQ